MHILWGDNGCVHACVCVCGRIYENRNSTFSPRSASFQFMHSFKMFVHMEMKRDEAPSFPSHCACLPWQALLQKIPFIEMHCTSLQDTHWEDPYIMQRYMSKAHCAMKRYKRINSKSLIQEMNFFFPKISFH